MIARFLVDLQQNSEPLRVGDITNETVTVHKGTVAAVCEKVTNIEMRVQDLQNVCQIYQQTILLK